MSHVSKAHYKKERKKNIKQIITFQLIIIIYVGLGQNNKTKNEEMCAYVCLCDIFKWHAVDFALMCASCVLDFRIWIVC